MTLLLIYGIFILVVCIFRHCGGEIVKKLTILLLISIVVLSCAACGSSSSSKGSWGSDGYYNPSKAEQRQAYNEAKEWVENNW